MSRLGSFGKLDRISDTETETEKETNEAPAAVILPAVDRRPLGAVDRHENAPPVVSLSHNIVI